MAKRRGNREGTIYKRADGRWCAQVSVNGRRLTKYAKTQSEMRDWLREVLPQVDRGLHMSKPKTPGEFLPSWLESVKPSIRPSTYGTYRVMIDHHDSWPTSERPVPAIARRALPTPFYVALRSMPSSGDWRYRTRPTW
jgi:hypothetical protein